MTRTAVLLLLTGVLAGCATAGPGPAAAQAASADGMRETVAPPPPTAAAADLPALGESAGLGDYLRYAALNNPGLAAAYYQWRAAAEQVPQARTLPEPKLTYARFLQEVETRVGPQENRLGVMQSFPWPGTLAARANVASEHAEAARWRYEQQRLALMFQVVDAYAEYYYLGRTIAITQENLELLGNFEEVARRRYEVAQTPYSSVVKAQVELGKLADRLRTLHDMEPALAAALNTALNRPADAPLPRPATLPQPAAEYDAAALRAALDAQSPALQALDSEVAAAVEATELARLKYFPEFTVGLDWIDTGPAVMRTRDSGKDPVIAMVTVSVPLWWESYRAAERQAQARVTAAQKVREDQRNTLDSRLERAVFRYDDARRKIDLYRNTLIPKAYQALEATQTGFTTGKADFLDLLDTQRILLEFELGYERALADSAQRDAEIRALVGLEDANHE